MKISSITSGQTLNGVMLVETEAFNATKTLNGVTSAATGTNAVLDGGNTAEINGEGVLLSSSNYGQAIKTFPLPSNVELSTNFPMLYINNEYKEFARISNLSATITLTNKTTGKHPYITTDKYYYKFTATIIAAADQDYIFGLISNSSYLFVTNLWRQVRFLVEKPQNGNTNNLFYLYTSDDILSNIFNNGACVIDVVNPKISEEDKQFVEGKSLFDYETKAFTYYATQDELHVSSAELIGKGTLLSLDNCENLTFRGLKFSKNGVIDITKGVKDQSEAQNAPCISINNCRNIKFENCEFYSVMGYCVSVDEMTEWNTDEEYQNRDIEHDEIINTTGLSITDCYVHDSGGGGFALNSCRDCEISKNLIKNYGLVQGGAVGILVRAAYNVDVIRNSVYNGPYSGISIGWTWEANLKGDFKSQTHNIKVENNHVHHCIQMTKDDGAGIYVLGVQNSSVEGDQQTVIRGNVVHDIITRGGETGSCIYLDEMSCKILAEQNICYGSDMCFQLHFGRENEIRNNLFAYSNKRVFWISRTQISEEPDTTNGFLAHNNILRVDSGCPVELAANTKCLFRRNLLDEREADFPLDFIDDNSYMEDLFYGPLIDLLTNRIILTRTGINVIDGSSTRVNGLWLMATGSDFEPWNFMGYGIPSDSLWASCNMTSTDMQFCDIRQQICQTFVHSNYFETN